MITQITGKLLEKTPTYVVIECNGIGYFINISLQTFSSINEEACKLFTHLSVKEDSHTLYGFYDQNERHLFRNLISVSGVGPSTAQVILSTYNPSEIVTYITTADVAAIQHVKTITLWGVTHPYAGFAPFHQPDDYCVISDLKKYPKIPCSIYGNKVINGYENAMETISPAKVIEKIMYVLNK